MKKVDGLDLSTLYHNRLQMLESGNEEILKKQIIAKILK